MQLRFAVTRAELVALLRELTPLRVEMAPGDGGGRWVEVERPSAVELVPGRGLRIVTSARLQLALAAGMRLPARIEPLTLMLTPEVVRAGGVPPRVALGVAIEAGEIRGVPAVIGAPLVSRLNRALAAVTGRMSWRFGERLTRSFKLPDRLEPAEGVDVAVEAGELQVEEDLVSLTVQLSTRVARAGELVAGVGA